MNAVKRGLGFVGVTRWLLCLLAILLIMHGAQANDATQGMNTYDTLGEQLADVINQQDDKRMVKIFNLKEFFRRAAKSVFTLERDINAYVAGSMKNGEVHLSKVLFTSTYQRNPSAKFIRTIKDNQPVVRLDYSDGGHEYLLLVVEKQGGGKLQIVDFFPLSSGQMMSETLGIVSQMLYNPSESLLKRLFGSVEYNEALGEAFKRIAKFRAAGNYKAAYRVLQAQPENIRTRRIMLHSAINLAGQIGETEYREQLALLDKYYGNEESAGFLLIDHHIYNGNFRRAQKSLDGIVGLIGEDGVLMLLKANTCLIAEDFACSEQYARKAIAIEPDLEDPYWTLISCQVHTEKYAQVVETLKYLEENFDYEFTEEAFAGEALYQDFIQSPEYKRWLL